MEYYKYIMRYCSWPNFAPLKLCNQKYLYVENKNKDLPSKEVYLKAIFGMEAFTFIY